MTTVPEGLRFEFYPIMWFSIIDGKAYFDAIK